MRRECRLDKLNRMHQLVKSALEHHTGQSISTLSAGHVLLGVMESHHHINLWKSKAQVTRDVKRERSSFRNKALSFPKLLNIVYAKCKPFCLFACPPGKKVPRRFPVIIQSAFFCIAHHLFILNWSAPLPCCNTCFHCVSWFICIKWIRLGTGTRSF